MNIFEGARRVAMIASALIIAGSSVAIYQTTPRVVIKYRVPNLGWSLKNSTCNSVIDGTRTNFFTTAKGNEFSIETCFAASKADNGKMLIPFEDAGEKYLMGPVHSEPVRTYMDAAAQAIVPTESDFSEADSEYAHQSWVNRLQGVAWLIAALVGFWLIVRALGWVVRGFAGIPSGQDYRITPLRD